MRRGWATMGLWLVGCVGQPPSPPQDSSTTEGTTGPGPVSVGDSTAAPGTTSTDDGASSDGPPAEGTSTGPGGGASLTISHGPQFDFGDVDLQERGTHTFTVTNEGDAEAVGMAGVPPQGAFAFIGGAYPGEAGTCGEALAAGESCLLRVEFAPPDFGSYEGTLTITHAGGPGVDRPLLGRGVGQTENLLLNPGGEDLGSPPPSWTDAGPGEWVAGVSMTGPGPYQGSAYLFADEGPNAETYVLQQDIDVTGWSALVEQELLRVSFSGFARALSVGNDQYRIRVRYLDQRGTQIDQYNTSWQSVAGWEQYQNVSAAPTGTRGVRVQLECMKNTGERCSAFFDALDLRALYP